MLLVDDRLQAARDHAAAGRHDNAALLFESILDISPGHPEALTGLIETSLARGDLQSAQSLLTKATAQSERDAGFLALAAKVALAGDNPGEAERLADRALAIDPHHVQAALLKAELLAAAGALADVEVLLNTVRAQTESQDILHGIARLYFSIGLFAPALASAREAHALDPDDAALNALVGQLLTVLADHGEAAGFLQKAHLQDPANPEYLLALANNAAATGQLTEALRFADRVKTLFPDSMPAWLCYIRIKAERGEAEEALRDFAPVAKASKNRMEAVLTLGTAYGLAGEPEKTLQLLEPLLGNSDRLEEPDRARLLSVLRETYLATGQLDRLPEVLNLSGSDAAKKPDEEALANHLRSSAMVVDPGLSNLEFMVMARFISAAGQGTQTPVIGAATLAGLVRLFGFDTFLPSDTQVTNQLQPAISGTFPVSGLLAVPAQMRGGLTGSTPYLPAREDRLRRWRDALSEYPRPWIGIAWNEAPPGLTLDSLLSGLPPLPGTLVSTIWDHSRSQLAGHKGIIDAGRHIEQLEDLAALVQVLDYVVGPDGIILHAAGASGTPGLALVPRVAPWYWFSEEGRSIWYPSLDVIRSPRAGHWATLLPELSEEIAGRFHKGI
ncbi:tetratricopeptide repeat protein [Labrenzia sp. VG12]|uniref:tetratricopeptide repeat protein n=1 Tax=Labrenzia sp. VG12 TaxID=2021862 RepID=UPI000B8C1299|nr:tetratricopeptide repeat protein [Labrenzia sp. VG12]ASP33733.1 hypothetical protein CHH27_11130 [Labrenzia sp. VG12]